MDLLTLSINTNRGTAMHAVIETALWVRRELEASGNDVSVGFAAMPEVRDSLDVHLDPRVDPSLAVHAVYGRWLPWLLLLDEAWVQDRYHVVVVGTWYAPYRANHPTTTYGPMFGKGYAWVPVPRRGIISESSVVAAEQSNIDCRCCCSTIKPFV